MAPVDAALSSASIRRSSMRVSFGLTVKPSGTRTSSAASSRSRSAGTPVSTVLGGVRRAPSMLGCGSDEREVLERLVRGSHPLLHLLHHPLGLLGRDLARVGELLCVERAHARMAGDLLASSGCVNAGSSPSL